MWVLESSGDFLQGKRMWLKPGKRYLFGRVKKDGVQFAIPHKTVSRQHFIIAVASIADADVGRIHARSKITIEDQDSKAGTHVDGQLHKGGAVEPKNKVISIRPGTSPDELIIKWVPCVVTFGLTKKELKNGVLKTRQERVKDLDIRAVSDYISGDTTHLVAQKRNTPKGLQALIEGRHIVTDAFVDYLIYLSAPTDIDAEETFCPLEIDFDANWPNAAKYLPPKGKEPTDMGDNAYSPNPDRTKVFEKHTFVFFSQSQYDNLLPPITAGHGKALCLTARPNTTTVKEVATLVRKTVGLNGHAVIVKLADNADPDVELENHIDSLGKELGQEPASQTEFLDTILTNSPAQLRKPWSRSTQSHSEAPHRPSSKPMADRASEEDATSDLLAQREPPARSDNNAVESQAAHPSVSNTRPEHQAETNGPSTTVQESSIKDENPRPRKRPRFVPSQRKVNRFDDGFNPDAVVIYEAEESPPTRTQTEQAKAQDHSSGDVQIKAEGHVAKVQASSHASSGTAGPDEDDMDQLLPAAAAMRKEKQREKAEAEKLGLHSQRARSPENAEHPPKAKKEVKMLDVREEARARRDAEDAAYKKEQQDEGIDSEDEQLKGPAKVVKVVGFDLPVRERPGDNIETSRGPGWKPEWEGRKNFKGFRRARDRLNGEPTTNSKIIVPVASTKSKAADPFQSYRSQLKDDGATLPRTKLAARNARTHINGSQRSSTAHGDSDSDNPAGGSLSPGNTRLRKASEGVLDHPTDIYGTDAPTQSTATSTNRSTRVSKRPASSTPIGRGTGAKKQKTVIITVNDSGDEQSSDDSDDLKFKFGRSKRLRAGA